MLDCILPHLSQLHGHTHVHFGILYSGVNVIALIFITESYRQAAKRLLSRKCKRKHLQLLGASQQGGQVETIDWSNGTILTVDPFKGIIFLQDRAAGKP